MLEQHKKALASGNVKVNNYMKNPSAASAKQNASAIHQKVASQSSNAAANSGNPFTQGIKPPARAGAAASSNLARAMEMQQREEAMGVGVN